MYTALIARSSITRSVVSLFMDPYSWLLLSFCILLIGFSAFFSGTESAFAGCNRVRLKNLAEDGNRRAARALAIAEGFDRSLIALLVGNNVVNTLCASLATVFALGVFTTGESTTVDPVLTLLITVVTTVVIFIFGELVPKTLVNANNDRAAMLFAPVFHVFCLLITPISVIVLGITALVKRLTGGYEEPTVTEDELSTIFSGAIDYSADKVQHQSDPDARIINAIARIDKDTERLLEKLDRLESNDQRFEKMIYEADGIGAEVVRLYVLEGLRWQDVAVQVGYSERYCQELYSRSTQTMWQKYEKSA